MDSPSPSPPQLLLTDGDESVPMAPLCLLAPRPAADEEASGLHSISVNGQTRQQQQKLSFRSSTTPFTSPPPHLTCSFSEDNSELATLRLALARARSEASLARQLRRENNRLKAERDRLQTELELRNNQLNKILQKKSCPRSPTSTLHTSSAGSVDMKGIVAFNSSITGGTGGGTDNITEQAIKTLLRNFDSFNLLSEEEDKSKWVEGQLIGEDLLSDDDSCSYSV